jgi:predicted pyridoxine 5'-phosphate oxidase superfamily flavin-nucleotide-binding protein
MAGGFVMATFGSIAYTDPVRATQRQLGSPVSRSIEDSEAPVVLGEFETGFIEAQDGFYQASVGETGWPYVQFRGGPSGFVRVLGPSRLGYADLRGNRQYISVGNLTADNRVALIFLDYAQRARIKVLGHARFVEDPADPDCQVLASHADTGRIERAVIIDVAAIDWNCRQHITPKFTEVQIRDAIAPLHRRIEELEAALALLSESGQ